MTRRFLQFGTVLGVFIVLLVVATAAVAEEDESTYTDASYDVNLPWVANGVETVDSEGMYSTVVVQNLEPAMINVELLVGVGSEGDDWRRRQVVELSAYASRTVEARDLGIVAGEGASVRARGLMNSAGNTFDAENPGEPARIAAVVKNAGATAAERGFTHSDHVQVDGYSGPDEADVAAAAGPQVLPIVQNNSGWETTIRLAHFGDREVYGDGPHEVSVAFSAAGTDLPGSSVIHRTFEINPGEVTTITLTEILDRTEWVGSAVVSADVPIGAIAERSKLEDRMLVTNLARPEQRDVTTQYAPLIFRDYHDWNTGIAIANTDSERDNTVEVTYFGPDRSVEGTDSVIIAPGGMNFIHNPARGDGSEGGFVGSARLTGTTSFQAVVDQVKYAGDDLGTAQGMSYVLEHTPARWSAPAQDGQERTIDLTSTLLALPLVQRGDPETSAGQDNSGIQLFNTSGEHSIRLEIMFHDAGGDPIPPTISESRRSPILITLGPNQSYTLYTPDLQGFPTGFRGSAIIEITGGDGGVVGISNNVNYGVRGDGSAAFSLIRVPGAADIGDIVGEP